MLYVAMYKGMSMAIHVQDQEADRLLRDFARRRGIGITQAIKTAVQEATRHEKLGGEALRRKIAPLIREVRANLKQPFSIEEDKAFMDEMWGEDP
jgi:antitoxin VapB